MRRTGSDWIVHRFARDSASDTPFTELRTASSLSGVVFADGSAHPRILHVSRNPTLQVFMHNAQVSRRAYYGRSSVTYILFETYMDDPPEHHSLGLMHVALRG